MVIRKAVKAVRNPGLAFEYAKRNVDTRASRRFFGNTAGTRNNITGRLRSSELWRQPAETAEAQEMRVQGYYTLGQYYDSETMTNIREEYEELINREEQTYVRAEHEGEVYSKGVLLAHERMPSLSALLTDEIIRYVNDYYDGGFRVKHATCWRNFHVPPEVVESSETFSDYWHCDRRETDVFKLFVNISDVTEQDGPFHIISQPQTNRITKLGGGSREEPGEIIPEDAEYIVKATGPSGTAMLCNTELCYHRAGHPAEGHQRDIIQLQMEPADSLPGKNWLSDCDMKGAHKKAMR